LHLSAQVNRRISQIQLPPTIIYKIEGEEPKRMNISIPTPLRLYAGGQDAVEVDAANVAEALDSLTQAHPDLRKHLFTADGKVRAFVNLYLNDEDVRYLPAKEATVVTDADTLSIIPSIAGGG
jgi:molybdopterin converting factor small subunit